MWVGGGGGGRKERHGATRRAAPQPSFSSWLRPQGRQRHPPATVAWQRRGRAPALCDAPRVVGDGGAPLLHVPPAPPPSLALRLSRGIVPHGQLYSLSAGALRTPSLLAGLVHSLGCRSRSGAYSSPIVLRRPTRRRGGVCEGRRPSLGRRGCASACRSVARDTRAGPGPCKDQRRRRLRAGAPTGAAGAWAVLDRPGACGVVAVAQEPWLTRPCADDAVGRSACSPERSGVSCAGRRGRVPSGWHHGVAGGTLSTV